MYLTRKPVAVLALLATACAGSAHHAALGVPATRVDGIYICPSGAAVAGYAHTFYPSNYPTPPPRSVRPGRCFTSTRQATAAGYALAKPPSGGVDVSGVYLVPPAPSLAGLCQRSARKAGLAVPCPTLIPGTPNSVLCTGEFPCAAFGSFVLEGSFAGPPGYVGVTPGNGHLWIIAYDQRSGVFPRDTLAHGLTIGHTTVRGVPGRYIAFPPGSALNSGHVVLIWVERGVTYGVSLHGHTTLNEHLDRIIAKHLRLTPP